MAHDIGWYRRQHKIWMQEKQGYIDAAEQAEVRTAAAVKAAETGLHQEYGDKLNEMQMVISGAEATTVTAENAKSLAYNEVTKLRMSIVELRGSNVSLETDIRRLEGELAHVRAELAAVQPTIELERSKTADFKALLDKVRDRMRRKDLEAESAIENRKALASAIVPGYRRT